MSSLTSPPDTPCIGVCSTAIGDDVCLGCARTFAEISFWAEMSAQQKAQCWASLPVRRVWMAIVRTMPGHLEILPGPMGEQARFLLRDGRELWLAQPYQQQGQRLVPLRCGGADLLLDVAQDAWPQHLYDFLSV